MDKATEEALWRAAKVRWSKLNNERNVDLQHMLDEVIEPFILGADICRILRTRGANIPHIAFERTLAIHCPSAYELVLPRWVDNGTPEGRIDVFLTGREAGDKSWEEGTLHTPGTYFQPGQGDEETAIRLLKKELSPARLVRWEQVRSTNLRSDLGVRASTRSVVYCGWLEGEPAKGQWFDLMDVLNGKVSIIGSHRRILQIGIVPFLCDKPEFGKP